MLTRKTLAILTIRQRSYPIPTPFAQSLELSQKQQAELEKIVRRHTSQQQTVCRSRIILLAAAGLTNLAIAKELAISEDPVRKWRCRWINASEAITEAEINGYISQFFLHGLMLFGIL